MTQPMTLTTARDLLADCLDKGCLGDGDAQALRLVLKTLEKRTQALYGLLGPASAVLDEASGLLEAGVLESDEERESDLSATLDDLAMHIGKADTAMGDEAP